MINFTVPDAACTEFLYEFFQGEMHTYSTYEYRLGCEDT